MHSFGARKATPNTKGIMNTEKTPLLANSQEDAKKESSSFTSTRVLAIAGLAVVLLCGVAMSPAGTQVSLAMG